MQAQQPRECLKVTSVGSANASPRFNRDEVWLDDREHEEDGELQEIEMPDLDTAQHDQYMINMTHSSAEIRPTTQYYGPVTFNQYISNGNSANASQVASSVNSKPKQSSPTDINGEAQSCADDYSNNVKKVFRRVSPKVLHCLGYTILFSILAIIVILVVVHYTILKQGLHDGISEDYAKEVSMSEETDAQLEHGVLLIRKERWGGRPPKNSSKLVHLNRPVKLVIIGHTASKICNSIEQCSKKLQTIQSEHVANGFLDIKYNFLVGGDGNIYEGMGWNFENPFKKNSVMISCFGNYDIDEINERVTVGVAALIKFGMNLGILDEHYVVVGQNQIMNTRSPGVNLLKSMLSWPHYSNQTIS